MIYVPIELRLKWIEEDLQTIKNLLTTTCMCAMRLCKGMCLMNDDIESWLESSKDHDDFTKES